MSKLTFLGKLRGALTDPAPYLSAMLSALQPAIPGLVAWFLTSNLWLGIAAFLLAVSTILLLLWQRERAEHKALRVGQGFHIVPFEERKSTLHLAPHPQLPKGKVWLRGIPFCILADKEQPHAAVVESARPTPANKPDVLEIRAEVDRVSMVYILMVVTYGVKSARGTPPGKEWDEKKVGNVRLIFKAGKDQITTVRLGHDIREFNFGNQPWAINALRGENEVAS